MKIEDFFRLEKVWKPDGSTSFTAAASLFLLCGCLWKRMVSATFFHRVYYLRIYMILSNINEEISGCPLHGFESKFPLLQDVSSV